MATLNNGNGAKRIMTEDDFSRLAGTMTQHSHPIAKIEGLPERLEAGDAARTELAAEINTLLPTLATKADLVEGKVPIAQLPEHLVYELGYYTTDTALLVAHPVASAGDYAYVYDAVSQQYIKYVWDSTATPPGWKVTESTASGISRIENYAGAFFTDSVKIDKAFVNLKTGLLQNVKIW